MQKIIPHLWFDTQAKAAVEFYVSIFPDSKIHNVTTLHETPSGDAHTVSFALSGFECMAISAGPYFKINPSISFMLNFDPAIDKDAEKHLNELWEKLSEGGKALMPLQGYPFSKRYGWIEDKFGVSWQLILTKPEGEPRPFIIPSLMFVGDVVGKAEEATNRYIEVFQHAPSPSEAKRGTLARYPAGSPHDKEGTVMFTDFMLAEQWFVAMDSGYKHAFAFNGGISFMVMCETQEEIDYFWDKLSAVPEAEQCGWIKDAYGVSWQIVPTAMQTMMASSDAAGMARITQAFLKMKKFDIAELERAAKSN